MGNWDVELDPNKDQVKEEELDFVQKHKKISCNLIVEPCNDCVSKQAVLDLAVKIELPDGQTFLCISPEDVEALPPVTQIQRTGYWIKMEKQMKTEMRNICVQNAHMVMYTQRHR